MTKNTRSFKNNQYSDTLVHPRETRGFLTLGASTCHNPYLKCKVELSMISAGKKVRRTFAKHLLFVGLIIFGFLATFPEQVFSQETEVTPQPATVTTLRSDKAYKLYIEAVANYESAHEIYLQRKSQYLRFGTLKSRQDAQEATEAMMQARDTVVISYFNALEEHLTNSTGVPEARIESLGLAFDAETQWFEEHKASITSATSLEDLVNKTKEAESRWKSDEGLMYEVLSTISYGKILDFSSRTNETFSALRQKIADIKQDEREEYVFSEKKFDILGRWVSEIEQRITQSKDVQLEAENKISEFATKKGRGLNSYNEVIATLGQAQTLLKEANTYMNEIIREIKTKEQ